VQSDDGKEIPRNATWADYCDALQDERWHQQFELQRRNAMRRHRLLVAAGGSSGARTQAAHDSKPLPR
jgi:hypothetical protein